ncbi:MAG: hypothetical protein M3083_00235 [Actinomycetota bacterium]|nr:hypothetical protein [Actinomycetota bacterium]
MEPRDVDDDPTDLDDEVAELDRQRDGQPIGNCRLRLRGRQGCLQLGCGDVGAGRRRGSWSLCHCGQPLAQHGRLGGAVGDLDGAGRGGGVESGCRLLQKGRRALQLRSNGVEIGDLGIDRRMPTVRRMDDVRRGGGRGRAPFQQGQPDCSKCNGDQDRNTFPPCRIAMTWVGYVCAIFRFPAMIDALIFYRQTQTTTS